MRAARHGAAPRGRAAEDDTVVILTHSRPLTGSDLFGGNWNNEISCSSKPTASNTFIYKVGNNNQNCQKSKTPSLGRIKKWKN